MKLRSTNASKGVDEREELLLVFPPHNAISFGTRSRRKSAELRPC